MEKVDTEPPDDVTFRYGKGTKNNQITNNFKKNTHKAMKPAVNRKMCVPDRMSYSILMLLRARWCDILRTCMPQLTINL
jgi:hypothetical protein